MCVCVCARARVHACGRGPDLGPYTLHRGLSSGARLAVQGGLVSGRRQERSAVFPRACAHSSPLQRVGLLVQGLGPHSLPCAGYVL